MNSMYQAGKALILSVNFLKVSCIVFIFSVLAVELRAQDEEDTGPRRGSSIYDDSDSSKQIYGPRTSRFFLEEDVFMNRLRYYPIDTVIRNFHRFNDVQRNANLYQDLGNIGTAIHPIYYTVPDVIGVTSGFSVFDVYWDREMIRHYDTKSPYSNMHVILGGRGRSITRATYSRNINPQWNFGFTYRGLFIDKQVGRQGKGDRNARSHYYDFHTAYETKDSTYRVFFNFRRNNHLVVESGGVHVVDSTVIRNFFDQNAQPFLLEAMSRELRMNIHLYHQYKVGDALQVYHKLDRYRQGSRFTDRPSAEPDWFFDFVEIDSDTTNDYVKFRTLRNEVGIKGNLLKLFYNGYVALRDYRITYNQDTVGINLNRRGTESYLGGRMALRLDSLVEVTGWVEVMETGNYRIEGGIRSRWFDAALKQVQYEPSFLSQRYRGAHDLWLNNFSSINVTQLSGSLHYRSSVLAVSPGLTFTRLGNYVFYKDISVEGAEGTRQDVMPVQSPGEQVIFSPMLRASVKFFRHVRLSGFGIYSRLLEQSDDAIQQPELFINGQLAYENIFFNGNLDLHTGVDVHWKSDYYAPAYDVPIRQFYVQQGENKIITRAFPIIDVFVNAKIKRARIFFKYNNLLQAFTKEGYFPTPSYIGQQNSIDFGFDWSFYD